MAAHVATAGVRSRRPRRALAILAVAAAALAAPVAADAQTLQGAIQGGAISLRDASGSAVTRVAPGTYTFQVVDTDTIHNFNLVGTAVRTPVDGTGTYTFQNVTLTAAVYTYQCDVHPDVNGTLTVATGDQPPPPPPTTAPAALARVTTSKVSGARIVAVTLSVARQATARAQVVRRAKSLASAGAVVGPGRRTLRIRLARRVAAGPATLKLTLQDLESGRTFVVRRGVRIPR